MTNLALMGVIKVLSIRNIQSRDILSLADTFIQQDETYFNTLYIDHLQTTRHSLIAVQPANDGERLYLGYGSVVWESGYTQFWRRNIPEITDLFVQVAYRRQGIATQLIRACERASQERGFSSIGISVEQSDTYQHAQALYQKLGYQADSFGVTSRDNQLHLVKKLS